jgi:hypothetical protein
MLQRNISFKLAGIGVVRLQVLIFPFTNARVTTKQSRIDQRSCSYSRRNRRRGCGFTVESSHSAAAGVGDAVVKDKTP